MSDQLPADARPIQTDELLAAIGELYVQVRVLRGMLMAQQQQPPTTSPNGTPRDAVPIQ